MKNIVVVGSQWGDEGKGKIVDWLSEQADVVIRFQGGHNAGHTLVIDGVTYKLRLLPSGIVRKGKISIIGNGVVVDPWALLEEIEEIKSKGIEVNVNNFIISESANLILPFHRELDEIREAVDVLLEFGIIATRIQGLTGVWAGQEKIAAQGVRISRWVTMHGFALNVNPDLSYYDGIIPCGIFDHGITSMEELLGKKQDMKEVKSVVIEKFNKLLDKLVA